MSKTIVLAIARSEHAGHALDPVCELVRVCQSGTYPPRSRGLLRRPEAISAMESYITIEHAYIAVLTAA